MNVIEPSIVRNVHYVSHGTPVQEDGTQAYQSVCRAAIITAVTDTEHVDLCVLNPTGLFFNQSVPYSADAKMPGTWHWPERA